LTEEPPPTLSEICLRPGIKTYGVIQSRFPKLAKAIIERHKEHRKKWTEEAKLELEIALTEVPSPSVKEIARRLKCGHKRLRCNFPDLYIQVVANHAESIRNRKLMPKKRIRHRT
jgi:hypothetical protein